MRAKRVGLKRNACVALGNLKNPMAIPALEQALTEEEALVRCHAAWALGQIGGPQANSVLRHAATTEPDPQVIAEVAAALSELEKATEKSG